MNSHTGREREGRGRRGRRLQLLRIFERKEMAVRATSKTPRDGSGTRPGIPGTQPALLPRPLAKHRASCDKIDQITARKSDLPV